MATSPIVSPPTGWLPSQYPADVNAANAIMVDFINKNRIAHYNAQCDDAEISIKAGRGSTVSWPSVPNAVALGPEDQYGVTPVVETTTAVCPARVPPPDPANIPEPPAGTIDIGADLGGGWFAAGPHDRVLPGTIITLPNGVKLQKVGFFMGNGWYQKVG